MRSRLIGSDGLACYGQTTRMSQPCCGHITCPKVIFTGLGFAFNRFALHEILVGFSIKLKLIASNRSLFTGKSQNLTSFLRLYVLSEGNIHGVGFAFHRAGIKRAADEGWMALIAPLPGVVH